MWEESTPQNAAKPGLASRENQFLKKLLMLKGPAPGSNKGKKKEEEAGHPREQTRLPTLHQLSANPQVPLGAQSWPGGALLGLGKKNTPPPLLPCVGAAGSSLVPSFSPN